MRQFTDLGDTARAESARRFLLYVDFAAGDHNSLLEQLHAELRRAREPLHQATVYAGLGRCYARLGAFDDAARYLASARATFAQHGAAVNLLDVDRLATDLILLRDGIAAGLTHMESVRAAYLSFGMAGGATRCLIFAADTIREQDAHAPVLIELYRRIAEEASGLDLHGDHADALDALAQAARDATTDLPHDALHHVLSAISEIAQYATEVVN
jgi:tetratricopeptide (TPR) repeat protein